MSNMLAKLAFYRQPIRAAFFRRLARKFNLFSYETRIQYGTIDRPHYGYCVLQAGKLAKKLGHSKVSVIEFGVAGGNGLLNLEMHAAQVSKLLNIEVQVFGFDSGQGLPAPVDYRDLPYEWNAGFFAMDVRKLQARLTCSKLVIGNVADTIPTFVQRYNPAPIGALLMDLDYYSSTKEALKLLDVHRANLLPRAFVYLDDITGDENLLYNEYTGVLLAIKEFNRNHEEQKICKTTYLEAGSPTPLANLGPERWHDRMYSYHDFSAPHYCTFISENPSGSTTARLSD